MIPGIPTWLSRKESTCWCRRCRRRRLDPWVRKNPWRRKWQLTPVFLPGESRGQRSLAGYSPWAHKESDLTERLSMHTHSDSTRSHNAWGWHVWTRAELAPPVFSWHVRAALCKRASHQLWKDDSSYLAVLWDWEAKLTRKGPELHSSGNLMSPSYPWRSLKSPKVEREIPKEEIKLPNRKTEEGCPSGSMVKNPPANAGDMGSVPSLGRCHMPQSKYGHVPQPRSPWAATREATALRSPWTTTQSSPRSPQLEKSLQTATKAQHSQK